MLYLYPKQPNGESRIFVRLRSMDTEMELGKPEVCEFGGSIVCSALLGEVQFGRPKSCGTDVGGLFHHLAGAGANRRERAIWSCFGNLKLIYPKDPDPSLE